MKNGQYIQGEFLLLKSEPWKNDSTRFNHRLIIVNTYQDNDGCTQTEKFQIDVLPDDLPILQAQAPRITGKTVLCPVRVSAKQFGSRDPYVSYLLPPGSKLVLIPSQNEQQKPAA